MNLEHYVNLKLTSQDSNINVRCYSYGVSSKILQYCIIAGPEQACQGAFSNIVQQGAIITFDGLQANRNDGRYRRTVCRLQPLPTRWVAMFIQAKDSCVLYQDDDESLIDGLKNLTDTPFLNEWIGYIRAELVQTERLVKLSGYNAHGSYLTITSKELDEIITNGIVSGKLSLPTASGLKISSIASIAEYVDKFSMALGDKVSSQCKSLHDPFTQPNHPLLKDLTVKPLPKQAVNITASVKSMKRHGLYIDSGKMGVGKTMMTLGGIHCHAEGKPYQAVVMCPSHLTKKWKDEVTKFLGGKANAIIITDWRHFMQVCNGPKPDDATWYIIAQTTAKLSYLKRAATIKRIKTVEIKDKATGFVKKQVTECHCCPRCDYPAHHRGLIASIEDIERTWAKCSGKWCKSCGKSYHHDREKCGGKNCDADLVRCNEPLYQPSSRKVSPAHLVKSLKVKFDYFIRDEGHLSKSDESMDAHAFGTFAKASKVVRVATGTLLDGKSESIRPMLFRLRPRAFKSMGFNWDSEIEFGTAYGRIKTTERSTSGGKETKRRSGKGSSKSVSRDIVPGIMPHLFPHYIANYTGFLSLNELATDLPLYTEETEAVKLDSKMGAMYSEMQTSLLNTFRELFVKNRKVAAQMMGGMLECLMSWPDVPYGRKPISVELEDGNRMNILIPPVMERDTTYAKERKLLEIIRSEAEKGRKCFVFSDRDTTRERLEGVLGSNGYKVAHLKSSVAPATRIEWLAKNAPACNVGLCNPSLIETGMELFGPGYNFPTLIWYSTGWKLNTLRQASRRSWRIGQKEDCRTIFLYYEETAQEKAIALMAAKLVAAEAIEGNFSSGGLADECDDDDMALAIAKALADGIETNIKKIRRPVDVSLNATDRMALLRQRVSKFRTAHGV